MAEQLTLNQRVQGSSPCAPNILKLCMGFVSTIRLRTWMFSERFQRGSKSAPSVSVLCLWLRWWPLQFPATVRAANNTPAGHRGSNDRLGNGGHQTTNVGVRSSNSLWARHLNQQLMMVLRINAGAFSELERFHDWRR